jgi:HSP20 family protein
MYQPPVDVTVSERDLVLTMDVPGLTAEDLSIDLVDGHLVVRGERPEAFLPDGSRFDRRERAHGRFERVIEMAHEVDADAITANVDHGVLSIIAPKRKHRQRRASALDAGGGPLRLPEPV